MFQFNLTKEANKIVETGFDPNITPVKVSQEVSQHSQQEKGILQEWYEKMFKLSKS